MGSRLQIIARSRYTNIFDRKGAIPAAKILPPNALPEPTLSSDLVQNVRKGFQSPFYLSMATRLYFLAICMLSIRRRTIIRQSLDIPVETENIYWRLVRNVGR